MRFSQKKLLNIGLIFVTMIAGTIMTYTNDTLKQTRLELEKLLTAEFVNCKITSVISRQYSGKGSYKLFKTDCSSEYYPILLEYGTSSDKYGLFEEGQIVNKPLNSIELTLIGLNDQIKLNIRHPIDEDGRIGNVKFVLIFFGVVIIIMLFMPISLWERKIS